MFLQAYNFSDAARTQQRQEAACCTYLSRLLWMLKDLCSTYLVSAIKLMHDLNWCCRCE